ncbi:Solute carrier family 10 member 6, partial [Stegodyphus mimosarum]
MEVTNNTAALVMVSTEMAKTNYSRNDFNETIELVEDILQLNKEFKPIIDYLLLTILIIIMLAMGCEITWTQLKSHILKPIGIGIGMVSQFFIMPLTAYSLMRSISITGLYATGVLIISCCPGGVLSNIFTYLCDGDLSLSVAMTTFSTLLAMGMMPLNIWIYGRSFETEDLVLPYGNLALSLIAITTPVGVGMILRWKCPRIATLVTKFGTYTGILIVIACIVMEVIVFPNMFTGVPGKLYGVVLSLPMLGVSLGYVLAFCFRQNMPVRKTIAIECGIQNVPTALTIISLSFKEELQGDIILLPWLYGFAMMSGCTVICITYRLYKRYLAYKSKKEEAFQLEVQDNLPIQNAV